MAYSRALMRPADPASRIRLKDDEEKVAEMLDNAPFRMARKKSVAPLDQALGVDRLPFRMTVDMMLFVARKAINGASYKDVQDTLREDFGASVSADTIRLVTNYVGALVLKWDQARADECEGFVRAGGLPSPRRTRGGTLYLETDGAFVRTRCLDGNGSPWRENKLGMAFSSNDIHFYRKDNGESAHSITRREYIGWLGGVEDYKWHFLAMALRNGYGEHEETVLLSDGARWIRNMRSELFPDAHQVLDIFHLFENVHEFARQVAFRKDEAKADEWAATVCEALEAGRWLDALAEVGTHKRKKVPDGCVNLYSYIEDNKDIIDYPTYRAHGWFVGSGSIESANRQVLHRRLKQAGMRWSPQSAQFVTSLRCKWLSGLWDGTVAPIVHGHFETRTSSDPRMERGPPTAAPAPPSDATREKAPCQSQNRLTRSFVASVAYSRCMGLG